MKDTDSTLDYFKRHRETPGASEFIAASEAHERSIAKQGAVADLGTAPSESKHNRIISAIQSAMERIDANRGKECYRFPYDIALIIKVEIESAGFKIVEKPKGKTLMQLAREGKL